MNIFRPAYFTQTFGRGMRRGAGVGACRCLGKEPSGKKALDEAGEAETREGKR